MLKVRIHQNQNHQTNFPQKKKKIEPLADLGELMLFSMIYYAAVTCLLKTFLKENSTRNIKKNYTLYDNINKHSELQVAHQ